MHRLESGGASASWVRLGPWRPSCWCWPHPSPGAWGEETGAPGAFPPPGESEPQGCLPGQLKQSAPVPKLQVSAPRLTALGLGSGGDEHWVGKRQQMEL